MKRLVDALKIIVLSSILLLSQDMFVCVCVCVCVCLSLSSARAL